MTLVIKDVIEFLQKYDEEFEVEAETGIIRVTDPSNPNPWILIV